MKTPKDFDYDIWKDDNGHYYIRVKRTGEVTRVSEEIVREMWREVHRMERHRKNTTILDEDGNPHARILSLDDSRVAIKQMCVRIVALEFFFNQVIEVREDRIVL